MSGIGATSGVVGDLEPTIVKVPKKLRFPIEPSGPIQLDVETLDQERYTLLIGGVGPLSGSTNERHPALCLRHFRLIVRMIYGRRFDAPEIPLRYSDLMQGEAGGKSRALLNQRIDELSAAWIHRIEPGKPVKAERLLLFNADIHYRKGVDPTDHAQIANEENITKRMLKSVRFNESFWRAFMHWERCVMIRADVLGMLTSDLVAAIYLYLTPNAYHPDISQENKGWKDAEGLLRAVGAKVPEYRSQIAQLFERQRGQGKSVLEALDYLPTADGYLRVDTKLEANASGTGYNIRYWIEGRTEAIKGLEAESKHRGEMRDFWIAAGYELEDFDRVQRPDWKTLSPYELERIAALGYDVKSNRPFLERIRAILGPQEFAVQIGVAFEKDHSVRDRAAWFGGILMKRYKEWVSGPGPRSRLAAVNSTKRGAA